MLRPLVICIALCNAALAQAPASTPAEDRAKALEAAGFALPDPDGGSGPTRTTKEEGANATTTVAVSSPILR